MPLRLALPVRETVAGHRLANPTSAPSNASVGRGGGLAQGLGVRVFAFGGAYWPLATAHSDPPWARTCFGCEQSPWTTCPQSVLSAVDSHTEDVAGGSPSRRVAGDPYQRGLVTPCV